MGNASLGNADRAVLAIIILCSTNYKNLINITILNSNLSRAVLETGVLSTRGGAMGGRLFRFGPKYQISNIDFFSFVGRTRLTVQQ